MFYTKTKLPNGSNITTELTSKNIFTKCPVCGQEQPVCLTELLLDCEIDLFSTTITCEVCTAKKRTFKDNIAPTFDGIAWLTHILGQAGYAFEIQELFNIFGIKVLDDLEAEKYADFAEALAKMAIGKEC